MRLFLASLPLRYFTLRHYFADEYYASYADVDY